MNKQIMIAIGAVILLIIVSLSVFLLVNREATPEFTGDSGQPETGALILTGYETPSNDSSKIPLGKFLSSDQQIAIRSALEAPLHKQGLQPEYVGEIVPGSVDVDYRTNIIKFKVQIEKPELLYIVRYNTLSDEVIIQDEGGIALESSHE